MGDLEKAEKIIEQILPKYFTFLLWQTEVDESGVSTKSYTQKADDLLTDILNVLKEQ